MIGLLLLVFSTISVVYASSIDDKYNNIEQYKSYMHDSNWTFANTSIMMNYLANFLFGIAKAIASITDFFLKALYQSDAINNIVDLLGDSSSTIYNNIFGKYGILLFFIGAVIAGIRYMVSAHRGVKDIFQLVLLIGICTLWVSNASTIIKSANEFSNDIQATIATSGDKLLGADEKLDSSDVLREKFFNQAVEQPFLLLNFNELDKEKVNNNPNFKGEDGKSRIDSLLVQRDKDSEQKYLEEYEFADEKKLNKEKRDKQNYYISDDVVTHKLTVSFLSVVMNLILMLPFNVIAFFNFIIQIQIVFYVLIVPFTLLASYLPFMRMSYISVFKNLFGLYAIKAMLGLVILFVSLVMNLTRKIMESSQATPVTIYTTSTILLVVSLFAMWKNRKQILSVLSAGGVGNIGISTFNGMMKKPRFSTAQGSGSSTNNQEMNKQENLYQDKKAPEETLDSPQVRERYNYDEVERTPQQIEDQQIERKEIVQEILGNKINVQSDLPGEQRELNRQFSNQNVERTSQVEYNQDRSDTIIRGQDYNYDNYRTSQAEYIENSNQGINQNYNNEKYDYNVERTLQREYNYQDTNDYDNYRTSQNDYTENVRPERQINREMNNFERKDVYDDYSSLQQSHEFQNNQREEQQVERNNLRQQNNSVEVNRVDRNYKETQIRTTQKINQEMKQSDYNWEEKEIKDS
jgi:hypothetical protein BATR1942_00095